MPGKAALIDFNRCQPRQCGTCPVVAACPRKLIIQESRSSVPMTNPAICRSCGDCVRACPLKAITLSAQ
ncbi:MAG: 4Fe-4S binding protein [Dehalococcoidales bacterium]|nr:4Fe-4S binding protein [Dehalococcoidales bacterium]